MDSTRAKQYEWNDALAKVQELAEVTIGENAALAAKVKELEVELDVWKRAHSDTQSATERENKLREEQLMGLARQNGSVLENQGETGGKLAAQELIGGIKQYMPDDKTYSLWTTIYINKKALVSDLSNSCTADELDAFLAGLSKSSPSLNIVDAPDKRETDKKIKDYIQTFAILPQTLRVFFSGGYEYSSILRNLEEASASSKLVLLQGQKNFTAGRMTPQVSSLLLDGLFMKSTPTGNHVVTEQVTSPRSEKVAGTDDEKLQLESSNSSIWSASFAPRKAAVIDPNLPLYKQTPPPCNEYYLLRQRCSKQDRCRYSHDYVLTEEQIETLSQNAKQSPCWYLNNDKSCPYGTECCWGHVCPFGIKCFFASKDRCRFQGSGMHRPMGAPSDPE
ncbi:hypothetical protein EWM64_g4014 [Hericium alpestre]|uniref:C3H1-type domain-containing protein n=1 Tax=Hericium alpestre TaxID=135208 RepID=A0A4Y9ZYM3_9AGAM|nr:hypothetical protein EWM64_g4014 [Hericium alpestre]